LVEEPRPPSREGPFQKKIRARFAPAVLLLAAAQPAAGAGQKQVTLPQLVALALEHNTDLRSSRQDVTAAHGALVQASAFANPDISVSALGSQQLNPPGPPVPNAFGVSWTVPVSGKRGAGIAAADSAFTAARSTNAAVRSQLELNAAIAFVDVLLAEALLSFAKSDQEAFRKTLELNELRYHDGKIAWGDVLKLRIQALSQDDTVRQSEQNLVAARADLAQLAGDDTLAPDFAVQGALEPLPRPPEMTPESLLDEALRTRPDYLAAGAQIESQKALVLQARRVPIPDLGVGLGYNHTAGLPDSFDLTLSVTVPLFDRNGGNIESAAAALEKSRIAQEALRNQIRDAAVKAVAEWRSSTAQVSAYRQGLRESARESLEIQRLAYERGAGSLLDFLDAETRYRQVESAFRSALARNAIAAYSLLFVAGKEIP
jgi:cobalt-zinc-cadmium efflux system outer membrane protein